MNAKHEQIQFGSSADAAERNDLGAPEVNATGMTEVSKDELDKVEGGLSAAARAQERQQLLLAEAQAMRIGTR